jgi:phosphoadenosine phosphosulfate reductase
VKEHLEQIRVQHEGLGSEDLLRWSFDTFQGDIAMASAFGVEGMVMIDMAARIRRDFNLFTIDTGFFFPETYELMDKVEKRYGVRIERVKTQLTPEDQERAFGPALWSHSPDKCCQIRKVDPLKQKLSGLRAWITAIRRDQTANRATARKIEWDEKFQILKVNPLADWTTKQVWNYVHEHQVPYNRLHDRGYPSIGCSHCTRAVQPGEDARAGRWSGFQKTECGLHTPEPQPELVRLSPEPLPTR